MSTDSQSCLTCIDWELKNLDPNSVGAFWWCFVQNLTEFLSAQTFILPGEVLMYSVNKDFALQAPGETNSPGPEAFWSSFVVL